jgi:hypothetical protein
LGVKDADAEVGELCLIGLLEGAIGDEEEALEAISRNVLAEPKLGGFGELGFGGGERFGEPVCHVAGDLADAGLGEAELGGHGAGGGIFDDKAFEDEEVAGGGG